MLLASVLADFRGCGGERGSLEMLLPKWFLTISYFPSPFPPSTTPTTDPSLEGIAPPGRCEQSGMPNVP